MLKGKLVLSREFFGRVLNDAENEACIVLQLARRLRAYPGNRSDNYIWEVSTDRVVVPWALIGKMNICEKMPKWLWKQTLKRG